MPRSQKYFQILTSLSNPSDCLQTKPQTGIGLGQFLFSCRFHIDRGTDFSLNEAMGRFKGFDIFPDQHQNVAVDAAALIRCHKLDLVQHFLFNSDGYTLYSHKNITQ